MARIIDLGNGYGQLKGYSSRYASLIFPIGLSIIRRLHVKGYLDNNETMQTLLDMGYEFSEAKLIVAIDSVTVEQWKDRVSGLGTI